MARTDLMRGYVYIANIYILVVLGQSWWENSESQLDVVFPTR